MGKLRHSASVIIIALAMLGCDGMDTDPTQDIVCGETDDYLWNLYEIQSLEGCTRYRGSIHVSDTDLPHLESLPRLRAVDGSYTFFRNDSLQSLRGLENLQVVGDRFGLSNHAVLADLDALSNLRAVAGDFYVIGNSSLHDDDARALADQISIGGEIDINGNAPR